MCLQCLTSSLSAVLWLKWHTASIIKMTDEFIILAKPGYKDWDCKESANPFKVRRWLISALCDMANLMNRTLKIVHHFHSNQSSFSFGRCKKNGTFSDDSDAQCGGVFGAIQRNEIHGSTYSFSPTFDRIHHAIFPLPTNRLNYAFFMEEGALDRSQTGGLSLGVTPGVLISTLLIFAALILQRSLRDRGANMFMNIWEIVAETLGRVTTGNFWTLIAGFCLLLAYTSGLRCRTLMQAKFGFPMDDIDQLPRLIAEKRFNLAFAGRGLRGLYFTDKKYQEPFHRNPPTIVRTNSQISQLLCQRSHVILFGEQKVIRRALYRNHVDCEIRHTKLGQFVNDRFSGRVFSKETHPEIQRIVNQVFGKIFTYDFVKRVSHRNYPYADHSRKRFRQHPVQLRGIAESFWLLIGGSSISGICLLFENIFHAHQRHVWYLGRGRVFS